MRIIIFADIDGVFTSARSIGYANFDIYAVNFIRWVCEKTGAKIVISSTWRNGYPLGFWRQIFFDHIFRDGDWKTPNLQSKSEGGIWLSPVRGAEIKAWLNKHETDDYLILDDDNDFLEEQLPHLIQTDSHEGLLFKDMMKIRDYFKIETFPREQSEIYQHPNMFAATRAKIIKPQNSVS